jgi:hypothetical protein
MSATEAVTASGMAPDGGVRIARAIDEALQLLDQARSRVQRVGDVTRIHEAASCLAEAERHRQEGPINTAIWRHIGEAVMLADQVGRQQRRFAELRGPTGQNLCAEVLNHVHFGNRGLAVWI